MERPKRQLFRANEQALTALQGLVPGAVVPAEGLPALPDVLPEPPSESEQTGSLDVPIIQSGAVVPLVDVTAKRQSTDIVRRPIGYVVVPEPRRQGVALHGQAEVGKTLPEDEPPILIDRIKNYQRSLFKSIAGPSSGGGDEPSGWGFREENVWRNLGDHLQQSFEVSSVIADENEVDILWSFSTRAVRRDEKQGAEYLPATHITVSARTALLGLVRALPGRVRDPKRGRNSAHSKLQSWPELQKALDGKRIQSSRLCGIQGELQRDRLMRRRYGYNLQELGTVIGMAAMSRPDVVMSINVTNADQDNTESDSVDSNLASAYVKRPGHIQPGSPFDPNAAGSILSAIRTERGGNSLMSRMVKQDTYAVIVSLLEEQYGGRPLYERTMSPQYQDLGRILGKYFPELQPKKAVASSGEIVKN